MHDHPPRIVLVGHCGPDAAALRSAIRSHLTSAEVAAVDDPAALEAELSRADVLLINRVLDGSFGGQRGVELIAALVRRRAGSRPVLMLVSNDAEAQRAAESAGAMPGFGKRAMYDAGTRDRLMAAVEAARSVSRT